MKKKSKNKSRFQRLPKANNGMTLDYLSQNNEIFTPQSSQFSSLASNTQYNNPNSLSANIRANNPNSFQNNGGIGEGINLNNTGVDSAGGFMDTQYGDTNIGGTLNTVGVIGSVGSSLIDSYGKDENQQKYTDSGSSWSQDVVGMAGPWGSAISGVSQLGSSALETGVNYNEYGVAENQSYNKLSKSLETGLLDPAQNLDVVFSDDYSTTERVGAALLPGLAGITQADQEQEEAISRELAAKQAKNQARLSEINQDVNQYKSLYKYGGKLKKLQNGSYLDTPDKLNPITPEPIQQAPSGYINKNKGLTPYYKGRDIRVPGYQRPMMGYIDNPVDNNNTPKKLYSKNLEPINKSLSIGISQSEGRPMTRESAILRTADILNEPVSNVRETPDLYFKRLIDQSEGYFQRGVSGTNKETLKEIIPTDRYNTKGSNKIQFKRFGGDLNNTFNRTPNITNYKGQTHDGPDEGIPVDEQGNPSVVSGKEPVALTENGEVIWDGYVFSNELS